MFNTKIKISIFTSFIAVILLTQLIACTPKHRKSSTQQSKYVNDELSHKLYQKLLGTWKLKSSVTTKHGITRSERIRLHVSEGTAKLEVFGNTHGSTELKYMGREASNDVIVFTFSPTHFDEEYLINPILATGKIYVSITKSDLNIPHVLMKHAYGRPIPLGSLIKPIPYLDWSNGRIENNKSHKKKLLSAVNSLRNDGWKCISQDEFLIQNNGPKTVSEMVDLFGYKLLLIYSPGGMPSLSYNMNNLYKPHRNYGYPTVISKYGSNAGGYAFNFELKKEQPHPVQVKLLMFTRVSGDVSSSPCDGEFQSPFFNPTLLGVAKIYLAVIANNIQLENTIDSDIATHAIAVTAGLTRNELMASGIKDIAPNMSDKEVGYISRLAFDFLKGDLIGSTISLEREKIFQQQLKQATSINDQSLIKITDVIVDLLIIKARNN